jgi:uncharacterized membrane protein YphA (DoxX/SURF4 family)
MCARAVPNGDSLAWNRRAGQAAATEYHRMSGMPPSRSGGAGERANLIAVSEAVPFHRSTVPPFHRSTVPPFHRSTVPPFHLLSLNGLAGILETFGGFAILLGLFTRPVAFVLAGEMAVAYFKVHIARSIFPINNRGDNVVLFCFIYLFLVFAGAGPWSIDAMIARSRRRRTESDDTLSA